MQLSPTSVLLAVVALAAVLGLVLLAGRAARAAGLAREKPGQRLILQEALALDRARRLVLVQCDGRDLLLLTGGGADAVIGWLPERGTGA